MDCHSGSREELILKVLTLFIVGGGSPLVFTVVETPLSPVHQHITYIHQYVQYNINHI